MISSSHHLHYTKRKSHHAKIRNPCHSRSFEFHYFALERKCSYNSVRTFQCSSLSFKVTAWGPVLLNVRPYLSCIRRSAPDLLSLLHFLVCLVSEHQQKKVYKRCVATAWTDHVLIVQGEHDGFRVQQQFFFHLLVLAKPRLSPSLGFWLVHSVVKGDQHMKAVTGAFYMSNITPNTPCGPSR